MRLLKKPVQYHLKGVILGFELAIHVVLVLLVWPRESSSFLAGWPSRLLMSELAFGQPMENLN